MQNPAPNCSTFSDPDVPQTLKREQVKSLYTSLPVSLLSSLTIAIILSISHWRVIGQAEIILWNLLLGGTLLARLTLWIFWKNAWQLYSARFWLQCFRAGVWLSGGAWGTAALLLFAEDNPTYQALLAFSLAGVASGSATSLTADKYSSVGFVVLAISPLSLFIFLEEGPTALAMSGMTLLFIFFVITSSNRTRRNMEEQVYKNEHLLKLTNELNYKQQLEKIINNAQSTFIADNDAESALRTLLRETLPVINSELGFIGQVDRDANGNPFMRALVFSSTNKNDRALDSFRVNNLPANGEFRNLNNLFGLVMQSGKPIISMDLSRDSRVGPMPDGHPHISNFIAVPIFNGRQHVAILGLANSPGGFHPDDAEKLGPVLKTIAQFVQTINHERRHAQDRAALEDTAHHTQTILNDIADGIVTIDNSGVILSFNQAAETIFGYRAHQIVGRNFGDLMPLPYRSVHNEYIRNHLMAGKKNIIGTERKVVGLRRNGNQFPMDLMMSKVLQQGESLFIVTVRDITERKRADESRTQFINSAGKKILRPLNLLAEAINCLKNDEHHSLTSSAKRLVEIAQANSIHLREIASDLFETQPFARDSINLRMVETPVLPLIEDAVKHNENYGDIYQSKARVVTEETNLSAVVNPEAFYRALSQSLQCALKYCLPQSEVNIHVAESHNVIHIDIEFEKKTNPGGLANTMGSLSQVSGPLSTRDFLTEIKVHLAEAKTLIEKMHGAFTISEKHTQVHFLMDLSRMEPQDIHAK